MFRELLSADMINQRSGGSRSASGVQLGTGRGTLRLRAKGPATVEQLVSARAGNFVLMVLFRSLRL